MPDLFEAFRKNGLGHMVPKHTKNHTHPSRSLSFSASQRHITPLQQAMLKDHARYQQTVPPEFAYGTSYHNAMQHSTPREMKAMSNNANNVFADAISSLDRIYYRGK